MTTTTSSMIIIMCRRKTLIFFSSSNEIGTHLWDLARERACVCVWFKSNRIELPSVHCYRPLPTTVAHTIRSGSVVFLFDVVAAVADCDFHHSRFELNFHTPPNCTVCVCERANWSGASSQSPRAYPCDRSRHRDRAPYANAQTNGGAANATTP